MSDQGCNAVKKNTHDLLPSVHPAVDPPHAHLYDNWCIFNANTETDLGVPSVLLQKSAGLPQVLHLSKQT